MPLFKVPAKSTDVKRKGKKAIHYDKLSSIKNAQHDSWSAIIKRNYEGNYFPINV